MADCRITVSGLSAEVASIGAAYPHWYGDIRMTLDILMKGPSLDLTEDNQIYDCFKAWRKRVEMLMTDMTQKKDLQEFLCHFIKAWSGETGHTHIEAVGLTGDNATSTKYILDTLTCHCKPRSNDIVAVTAYKQWVQEDPGLPECIEKCNNATVACSFGTAYDKCWRNSILLGLRNQQVCEKRIKVGDQLTSTDVIQIASEVYNSERQLSIYTKSQCHHHSSNCSSKHKHKWATHGACET